jgi:hypothetical protein
MSTPVANINSPDEGDEGYFNNYQDVESVEDNIE